MKNTLRYVYRNFFRAGFFSMSIGLGLGVYGIVLLARHNQVGWFEIAMGLLIVGVGVVLFRVFRQLEYWRKRLVEIEHEIDLAQRGIRHF